MEERFLSPKVVCEKTALSRSTLDRLVNAGQFPKPIKIAPRRVAYRAAAVEQWMAEKMGAAA